MKFANQPSVYRVFLMVPYNRFRRSRNTFVHSKLRYDLRSDNGQFKQTAHLMDEQTLFCNNHVDIVTSLYFKIYELTYGLL